MDNSGPGKIIVPKVTQSESYGKEPIKWNGKVVGYLNWSIDKYQQSDSGGLMTLTFYNDSSEDIEFCITGKNADRCTKCGVTLRSQQRKEVVFACSERVSDFSFNITVD